MFRAWIFDLDGTLTVPQHDFAFIKRELGLPAHKPVLDGIAERPIEERAALLAAVDAWERGLADRAEPNPGASDLLAAIAAAGLPMGVLTLNTKATALRTLEAAGLAPFFSEEDVLGRDEARPKPAPDGLILLMERFGAEPRATAMVGDYRFDLLAGRAAGAVSIWLDPARTGTFDALADQVVCSLLELRVHLSPTGGRPPGATS